MQQTGRKSADTDTEQGIKERQEDATSKETLSELRENEKVSQSSDASEKSSIPSPDGQVRGKEDGRADGSDSGDPM